MSPLFQVTLRTESTIRTSLGRAPVNVSSGPRQGLPRCRQRHALLLCAREARLRSLRAAVLFSVRLPSPRTAYPPLEKIYTFEGLWYNLILPYIYVVYIGKKNKVILSRGNFILASLRMLLPADDWATPPGTPKQLHTNLIYDELKSSS